MKETFSESIELEKVHSVKKMGANSITTTRTDEQTCISYVISVVLTLNTMLRMTLVPSSYT